MQQLLGTPTDGCTWWLQAWLPAGFIIPGARESDPGVSEGHTRGGCIFLCMATDSWCGVAAA